MIYEGITRADYNALEGINNSSLKHFKHSVKHGAHKLKNPITQTAAMRLGTAFHTLVLEPQKFSHEYIVGGPINERTGQTYGSGTKAFAEWVEKQGPFKSFLSNQDNETAQAMAKATIAHNRASWYLRRSKLRECAFTWVDADTGIKCKCLIDFGSSEDNFMGDLKSISGSLDEKSLSKALASMDYHQQYAFYLDGAKANGLNPAKFVNIFQQSTDELDTVVAEIGENSMHYGRLQYKNCLDNYQRFLDGDKSGYHSEEIYLDIPYWSVQELMDQEEADFSKEIQEAFQ